MLAEHISDRAQSLGRAGWCWRRNVSLLRGGLDPVVAPRAAERARTARPRPQLPRSGSAVRAARPDSRTAAATHRSAARAPRTAQRSRPGGLGPHRPGRRERHVECLEPMRRAPARSCRANGTRIGQGVWARASRTSRRRSLTTTTLNECSRSCARIANASSIRLSGKRVGDVARRARTGGRTDGRAPRATAARRSPSCR